MFNVSVLNQGTIYSMNKCRHDAVDKFSGLGTILPLAPLSHRPGYRRKLVQVLLHHVDQLDAADHVVAATVDDEDIWCSSSSHGVEKEGRRPFHISPPTTVTSGMLPKVSAALWAPC